MASECNETYLAWEEKQRLMGRTIPTTTAPYYAGQDRGEKPREVTGDSLTEDDAESFARQLGVTDES